MQRSHLVPDAVEDGVVGAAVEVVSAAPGHPVCDDDADRAGEPIEGPHRRHSRAGPGGEQGERRLAFSGVYATVLRRRPAYAAPHRAESPVEQVVVTLVTRDHL